jgi:hypothetical protein
MPSNGAAHLSDEQVARYQDGELSAAEAAHLEICAECAARLRDLNAALAAYTEYRDAVRDPQLPAAPKPWRSLDQLVGDAQPKRRGLAWRWWLPALAATLGLAAALVAVLQPPEETSTQASQLLDRAALVPMPPDRVISMQVHGRTLLRPAVLTSDAGTAGDPELTHLQGLFQAAHYGWQDPLNPRTFQAWRGARKNRRDSVTMVARAGAQRVYRVRTAVKEGVLRAASLTLRAEDLRPTGADFEFEGEGPVSMEEAPGHVMSAPAPRRPTQADAPQETPAGPADTLRVLEALDEIGADTGEPVDVSEGPGHRSVVVRLGDLSPERQQTIAAALAALPRVTVDLQSGSRGAAPNKQASPQTYSSSIPPALRQRFEERLGGPVALQEATDRTLEASALILARAHAMEVLARAFPPETEARLSSQDRLLLRRLRRRHCAELERLAAQIRSDLRPVLDAPNAEAPPSGDNGSESAWQAGVPSLVAYARETDQLLSHLLAGSYSQSSGEDMLRGLAAAIQRLEWTTRAQSKTE